MNLLQATRLKTENRLALVGAGGKTTALFQLARQLLEKGNRAVILTATTHLAVDQLALADQHIEITRPDQLTILQESHPVGVILLTGPRIDEDQRTSGLTSSILEEVLAFADRCQSPLLVEADGSRRRPLKAPAGHEPAVPAWVDTVIVVAGLSGLGKPLNAEWVHRPEIFAGLSGLELDQPVTLRGLERVLSHPDGGLKNIPPTARRLALLNQADSAVLQAAGAQLADQLLANGYSATIVASLAPASEAGSQIWQAAEPVAGIILAAGGSTRFGRSKQLLDWRGEPAVRQAARTALAAGLSPVVVVTGADAAAVQAAVSDLAVRVVENPNWAAGQATSLIAGLGELPGSVGAAVFLLADQPQAPATLVRSLVARHAETLSPIVAPLIDGQRGNPVLFDQQTFSDLKALQGDTGGRALFGRYPVTWLPWHDASLLLDIDRPEDYQRLIAVGQAVSLPGNPGLPDEPGTEI